MNGFLSLIARQPLSAPAALLLCAAFSACAAGTQATYAGQLTPVAGACDAASRATLQRHGANVQFTPTDGVLTLDGTVAATGQITAAQQTMGMDRKPYRLTLSATLQGDTITGTYVTPRCRYRVALRLAGA